MGFPRGDTPWAGFGAAPQATIAAAIQTQPAIALKARIAGDNTDPSGVE